MPECRLGSRAKESDARCWFLFFFPSFLNSSDFFLTPPQSESDQQNTEAANYYKQESAKLYDLGIRVDLFCIGNLNVGIGFLKHLARGCGGYIFTYKSAGIELESDLFNCLFRRTYSFPLLPP